MILMIVQYGFCTNTEIKTSMETRLLKSGSFESNSDERIKRSGIGKYALRLDRIKKKEHYNYENTVKTDFLSPLSLKIG